MSLYLRLSEKPYLHSFLLKYLFKIAELNLVRISLYDNGFRCARAIEAYSWNRQSEQCACVQSEL